MDESGKSRDSGIAVLFGLLVVAGLVVLIIGISRAASGFEDGLIVFGLGVLGVTIPACIYPLLDRISGIGELSEQLDQHKAVLDEINERMLLSDQAKRIAYREKDREALRKAIDEDIASEQYDVAIVLIHELAEVYGYREEAENLRQTVNKAQQKQREKLVDAAINRVDEHCKNFDWETAYHDADRLVRLYPNVPRVMQLRSVIDQARESRKQELERQFLRAAEVDDVETAMELVNELDKYLTPEEAEPFRETARGVFGKKRQNLGLTFKLAVENRDWLTALNVGEQIITDFPNSKYAAEVRTMLDVLRERAAGQRAADASRTDS